MLSTGFCSLYVSDEDSVTTHDPTDTHLPDTYDDPVVGRYVWHPGPDQMVWSPALSEIYGVDRAPENLADFAALLHPQDRVRIQSEIARLLRSDDTRYSRTYRIVRPDGQLRIILDRGVIERGATELITRVGINIDVSEAAGELAGRLEAPGAGESRYQKLFAAIDEGFCIVEVRLDAPDGLVDYRVIEANPAFYEKTGFSPDVLGAWLREAAPGLEEHWFETYGGVARDGKALRFESPSEFLGRWFDVYAFPIDEPEQSHVAILFNDVTFRKHDEEQARLVVEEINHRSRNMLGVIQAIARHTLAGNDAGFLQRFGERIHALAASNDLLAKNKWRAVSLSELVQSQLAPFADEPRTRFELDGPAVFLTPVATKALGMAVHELATNAVKYGALANDHGRIVVTWSVRDEAADQRLHIWWQETDGPAVQNPSRTGFGSKVTSGMVESSMGGKVEVSYASTGLSWRLDCPIDNNLV